MDKVRISGREYIKIKVKTGRAVEFGACPVCGETKRLGAADVHREDERWEVTCGACLAAGRGATSWLEGDDGSAGH